jgi:hypothetical protein
VVPCEYDGYEFDGHNFDGLNLTDYIYDGEIFRRIFQVFAGSDWRKFFFSIHVQKLK